MTCREFNEKNPVQDSVQSIELVISEMSVLLRSQLPSISASPVVMAENLYNLRRRRNSIFDEKIFGEPSWDILLDLYVSGKLGREVSVSSACIAASVPATTALRWISVLVDHGYVERSSDSRDGRRALVKLSSMAESNMERLLFKMARQ